MRLINLRVLKFSSIIFLTILFSSCNNGSSRLDEERKESYKKEDSLKAEKIKADSIAIVSLKVKKTAIVQDKTVTIIGSPKIAKKVNFEYDFGDYGGSLAYSAQRDELIVSIRIKLTSKSKWGDSSGDFLPNLNIYKIGDKNKVYFIGEMKYQLYRKDKVNYTFLEQRFDYQESEEFVCWKALKIPINNKYVISVNNGKSTQFDIKTVIGVINPQKSKSN